MLIAHLGQIWYHSEPSDVPYSPNQFFGWELGPDHSMKTSPNENPPCASVTTYYFDNLSCYPSG